MKYRGNECIDTWKICLTVNGFGHMLVHIPRHTTAWVSKVHEYQQKSYTNHNNVYTGEEHMAAMSFLGDLFSHLKQL